MAPSRTLAGMVTYSPPVDFTQGYDPSWVAGKTILITGGASGFGEGFSRHWAHHGANIIVGDINNEHGQRLVTELRESTGRNHHHFLHCDVRHWQSQVDMFRSAAKLSLHGGIDAVVANAGIMDSGPAFQEPQLDAEEPPEPDWQCLNVNLIGVMYTAHLAMYYLPKNTGSKPAHPDNLCPQSRDRHLLLIGSLASIVPVPGQVIYGIAKHGVMGLFRQLRISPLGMRINMICPYFTDTPIIPTMGRLLLAGGGMGKPEDVVAAGTRLMSDTRIMGRVLVVGPKVRVDDKGGLAPRDNAVATETASWEVYAGDFEETEVFTRRIVRLLNQVEAVRGWAGWAKDVWAALYGSIVGIRWRKR